MNKSAIQKYAIWARNELRDQIAKRGYYFGIDADGINVDGKDETCVYARDGRLLTDTERKQRNELFRLVKEKGFDQVVEEVSYTWFNRLIALRFMEVNDYLPEHIRVLSNANNEFKPEIKTRALDLEDPHFDKKKILNLIDKNDDEELYRYLLLTECNALNDILPQMFEKIGGYTELLLPNNLLKADSVIGKLVSDIDEADWDVKSEGGQVQIIGWLYQYYNQELKDQTFNDLKKKNKKISKERIPAATQLFTPDWIVHYMVENSLGRMWIEGHPNDELKSTWKYYLDEAEQEPEVEDQLKEIRKEYSRLNPQDIKFLDPAMGSGHILVVAFDILMQIYESQGIRPREAAKSILENNLYGLDIDDRAAQLAYFAVMMKAREYDRRIFSRGIQPNLYSIQESNGIDDSLIDYIAGGDKGIRADLKTLVKEMKDAKEYGSIIKVSELDFDRLEERLNEVKNGSDLLGIEAVEKIIPIVKVDRLLTQKYEIVCTNPPYMGSSNMNGVLSEYIKKYFEQYKADFFSTFIVKCSRMVVPHGKLGFLTPYVWMFIQSYDSLQKFIYEKNLETLIQFEYSAFEEATVPICAFTFQNEYVGKNGCYVRLTEIRGGMDVQRKYYLNAISNRKCGYLYSINQANFNNIPGSPVAYWISPNAFKAFKTVKPASEFLCPRIGLVTGDTDRFLRLWYEVNNNSIYINCESSEEARKSGMKWFPYQKGGNYRKWFGNNEYIINWENDGWECKNDNYSGSRVKSHNYNGDYAFKQAITWTKITSGNFACRFVPVGYMFDDAGPICTVDKRNLEYGLCLLNSSVGAYFLKVLSPTMNFLPGHINAIPFDIEGMKNTPELKSLVRECIKISKDDWDSYETSFDFKSHPLIQPGKSISEAYNKWEFESHNRFHELKDREEVINRQLINIYGLEKEVIPEVADKDITVRKADLQTDIKSLISYIVGCMFGRYSIDSYGLSYGGGKWDFSKYISIIPDFDNVIPIGTDEYFEDDIFSRFIECIKSIYGTDKLEENLSFIAKALVGKGTPREVIRNYFLNDFFNDHCKMYKKRPIYWLFDSGKKNGFKCLIYMHHYTPDTLARIRTDYVHEQQERYRSQIKHIQETIDTVSKSEQVKMKKELKDLEAKSKEVAVFEEKLHHLADQMIEIDLDDGVKHNYALFQDVLAKIK